MTSAVSAPLRRVGACTESEQRRKETKNEDPGPLFRRSSPQPAGLRTKMVVSVLEIRSSTRLVIRHVATTVIWAARPTCAPRWTPCARADSAAVGSPCRVSTRVNRVPPISRPTYRSTSALKPSLDVPRTPTTRGDGSFAVAGARVWNSLPAAIRRITGLRTVQATSENTFTQGPEIAAHCDS